MLFAPRLPIVAVFSFGFLLGMMAAIGEIKENPHIAVPAMVACVPMHFLLQHLAPGARLSESLVKGFLAGHMAYFVHHLMLNEQPSLASRPR